MVLTPVEVKLRTRAGTYFTFERRYQPIRKPDGSLDRSWNDPEILTAGARHVWTMIDCDGKLYLVPGFHTVNFISRVLCKQPWSDVEEANPGYLY